MSGGPIRLASKLHYDGAADSSTERGSRFTSLDALRGAVMVLMALDHVRDFFHTGAMSFSPTDLTKTTTVLFLTRWITHLCLPVFMFTAGTSAFLWRRARNHTTGQLSFFLWTRGIWFVLLELTLMQLAYDFSVPTRYPILLLILWIFGFCMVVMAGLVHLHVTWLLALSLALIATHNCLDGISAAQFGSSAWVWNLVHQPGIVVLAGRRILVTYTLVPWIAVMTAGFCFGTIFQWQPDVRQRLMRLIGLASISAFLLLRAINVYGDPIPWSNQKSVLFTVLSFLNCTKYPASLDFLLMTLGPALLALAYLDRHPPKITNPVVIFGRVPMFYFILHFYVIHASAVLFAWMKYGGTALSFVFNPPPSMGTARQLFPPDFGYSLWVTYIVWLVVVVSLYPLCKWYANIKARRRSAWLSYL
jgi:uncharacterized membrane protein